MAMARKLLGVAQRAGHNMIGKGTVAVNRLLNIGGEEAVDATIKKVAQETGEKIAKVDSSVAKSVQRDKTYRETVKAARNGTGEAAQEAIRKPASNYKQNTSFRNGDTSYRINDGKYQKKVGDSDWTEVKKKEYGHERGRYISENQQIEDAAEEAAKVAQEAAESGAGFLNGVPGWAKGIGLATAGVIAGNTIFDTDEGE